MSKHNEINWCPASLLLKLFFVSFLLQFSLGIDIFDGDKRHRLIPVSRIGGARLLEALEGKSLAGGLMAYPRLGRQVWELHQTLIPYPRAGRLVIDPESLDYEILLDSDYSTSGIEDSFTDDFLSNQPIVQKRRNVKLIPRIGRKKRSIPDEENKKEQGPAEENDKEFSKLGHSKIIWDNLDGTEDDYFFADKKSIRSKNAFVPRIGKKWSDYLDYEEKRARAFTPRIGRASLIPRIGRSDDPRFRLKSRASFIPRIGRRAALIPRIGRSDSHQNDQNDSD